MKHIYELQFLLFHAGYPMMDLCPIQEGVVTLLVTGYPVMD